ncbi:MAG: hypothetical protein NTX05_03070 [Fusobacteria bacterium]|nr:hypothetical protein [Fusobacteriota bacterium]
MKNFFIIGIIMLLLSLFFVGCGGGSSSGSSQNSTGGVTVRFSQIMIYSNGTGLGQMTITNTSSTYAKEVSEFTLSLLTNTSEIEFSTFSSGLYNGVRSNPPTLESTTGNTQVWKFLTPGLVLTPGESITTSVDFLSNRVVHTETTVSQQGLATFVQGESVVASTLNTSSKGTVILRPTGISQASVNVQIFDQSNHLVYTVPNVIVNQNTSVSLPATSDGIRYTVFYEIVEINGQRYTATTTPDDGTVFLKANESKSILGEYALAWQSLGNPGISSGRAYHTSIETDGTNVYVLYQDGANGDKATVKMWNGSSWTNKGNVGFGNGGVQECNLIYANGNLYASFRESNNNDTVAIYRLYGSTWEKIFPSVGENYIGYTPSIASESSGEAHVSKYTSSWTELGLGGMSDGDVQNLSLDAVSSSLLYVSYCDLAHTSKLTVKKYDGLVWSTVGKSGITNEEGLYTSVIAKNNVPYVSFSDFALSQKLTVLYYPY